jgi:transcriptional regulator with XRE-family HTH domain/tetratricopeptide (TPR) repeat protein
VVAESFGSVLRRLRVDRGLTQEQLAELASVSPTGLQALESGRSVRPRLSTASRLADALGLTGQERIAFVTNGAGPSAAPGATAPAQAPVIAPSEETDSHRPFVGRHRAMAALIADWERRTRLVILSGEAGIGKTRLTRQFGHYLADTPVLMGDCREEPIGVYDPFVNVLRGAVSMLDEARLTEQSRHLDELQRLLPEVGVGRTLGQPTSGEKELERRRLCEAATSLICGVAPVVVVLDDIHWADRSTLTMLTFLVEHAATAELMVVVTLRPTDADVELTGRLAELSRQVSSDSIRLGGLDLSAVASLIAGIAGGSVDPEVTLAIERATDGNPFFVEELAGHLADQGWFDGVQPRDAATVSLQLPSRLRDTVLLRFSKLMPDAIALLSVGSVLGRDFDVYLGAGLCGLYDDRLVAAVDDALLSGLVVEGAPGQLSFKHAVVQSAVQESLTATRRVAVHRAAAESLEGASRSGSERVPEIAWHWRVVAGSDRSAATEAARWTVRAGESAAAGAAHEEAIIRYEEAVSLWGPGTGEHVDTLIRLGEVLFSSGRVEEANQRFVEAMALARTLGAPDLLARAALGFAAPLPYGRVDRDIVDALEEAIGGRPEPDLILRTALMAMLMRHLAFDRSPPATRRRSELSAAIGRVAADPDASDELFLTLAEARDSVPIDDPAQLEHFSSRVVSVATRYRRLPALANGWYQQAWSALERGDGANWRGAVQQYVGVADRMLVPYELGQSSTLQAAGALIEGRYKDAASHGSNAVARGSEADNHNAAIVNSMQVLLAALDRGRAETAYATMRTMVDMASNFTTFHAALAATAAMAGDIAFARTVLDEAGRRGFPHMRFDSEWIGSMALYCEACVRSAAVEHAESLHGTMLGIHSVGVRVAPVCGWWGPVAHHLGALERLLGQLDAALEHLNTALSVEASMRAVPFEARTLTELARVQLAMGGTARRDEAADVLARAEAAATGLGALGIATDVQQLTELTTTRLK